MKQVVGLIVRLGAVFSLGMALWLVPFELITNLAGRAIVSDGFVEFILIPRLIWVIGLSVLSGAFFGVTLGLLNYFVVRAAIGLDKPLDLNVTQSRVLQLSIDPATAYQIGETVLPTIGARLTKGNQTEHQLEGRTGFSWKSNGEVVSISISPLSETQTHITLHSRPTLRTTLADFGKNYENVERMAQEYTRRSQVVA